MEMKTNIHAEPGKQELVITRKFELSAALVYQAYTVPEYIEQWMGNQVVKLENHAHGGYIFITKDPQGKVLFQANGTIHSVVENKQIVRTFEMENAGFPVQLEFIDFHEIDDESSTLTIKIVFKSAEDRDNMLRLPFAHGINMAHGRLQEMYNS